MPAEMMPGETSQEYRARLRAARTPMTPEQRAQKDAEIAAANAPRKAALQASRERTEAFNARAREREEAKTQAERDRLEAIRPGLSEQFDVLRKQRRGKGNLTP